MTTVMDLDTERTPLSEPIGSAVGDAVRPFGLSVTRWEVGAKHERDKVTLDPDSQIGYIGDRPLRELTTAGSHSSWNSDGQTVITLDWGTDDKRNLAAVRALTS